jgi:hypothetical protein
MSDENLKAPAPEALAPLTFRATLAERIGVTSIAVFTVAISLFMLVAAAAAFSTGVFFGLVLLLIAAVVIALTFLVTKETVSRWRLYAHLEDGVLTALLPRRRGFIDQPRDRVSIALGDIARIETRHESFASLGVTAGQQAYALVKRDGERVFLGADREWIAPFFSRLADAVAARANVPLIDLGMVDGDAGFLLVAFHSAPDWAAPSLPPEEIAKRNRRRARTGAIMGLAALLVILAQVFSRG